MNKKKDLTNRLTILAFEGPDKVGKSSLINEVNKRTNYEYLCVDRFLGSAWVYDNLYGRRNREITIELAENEISRLEEIQVINILLKCDRAVLVKRIILENEHPRERIKNVNRVIELYDEYSKHKSLLPIIEVDTTNKSVGETANEIISKIQKL